MKAGKGYTRNMSDGLTIGSIKSASDSLLLNCIKSMGGEMNKREQVVTSWLVIEYCKRNGEQETERLLDRLGM